MPRLTLLRLPVALGLLWSLGGCTSTHVVRPGPTPEAIADQLTRYPKADLQVTDTTGARYWISKPALRADTLVGSLRLRGDRDSLAALHLGALREVVVSHSAAAKTAGLVLSILTALTVAYVTIHREPND